MVERSSSSPRGFRFGCMLARSLARSLLAPEATHSVRASVVRLSKSTHARARVLALDVDRFITQHAILVARHVCVREDGERRTELL